MHKFKIKYESENAQNIFDVSGNNIQILGYTIIYLHNNKQRKPLKVEVARNLRRDGKVIMSLRILTRIGAMQDVWPVIDETKWEENLYNNLDMEFEDEVNKVIEEGANSHDIARKEQGRE